MRKKLGTFRYGIEVANAARDAFLGVNPLVDTGALYSQFPTSFLERLGHRPDAFRQFRLADGSVIRLPIGDVPVRIAGEVRTVTCAFGAEGSEPLLGATTLEAFSLAPDPVNETLTPVVAMLATVGAAE
jgi:predicted aspartyl protease